MKSKVKDLQVKFGIPNFLQQHKENHPRKRSLSTKYKTFSVGQKKPNQFFLDSFYAVHVPCILMETDFQWLRFVGWWFTAGYKCTFQAPQPPTRTVRCDKPALLRDSHLRLRHLKNSICHFLFILRLLK